MSISLALIISISLNCFLSAFSGSSINIAVPFMANDFNTAPENITHVINVFTASAASFLLPSAALANRFGNLKILKIGTVLTAITTLIVPLSPTFAILLFIRILQGIALSMVFCTGMSVLVQQCDPIKKGTFIGISASAVYAGLSLSPVLGGFITDTFSWRAIFYITAIGFMIAFFFMKWLTFDKPISQHYNIPKNTLSFIALFTLIWSLSNISEHEIYKYTLGVSIILVAIYLYIEQKSKRAILNIQLLSSNKILSFSLIASFFNYMSNFTMALLLAMYLQIIIGYSATITGFILLVQPLVQTLVSPKAGSLVKKYDPNWLCAVGMIILLLAIFILIFIDKTTPLYVIFIAQFLAGFGFGLFSAPNTFIVMGSVPIEKAALASALQALSRNFGMAIGIAILASILHSVIDVTPENILYNSELNQAINLAFLVSTIVCALGLVFCLIKTRKKLHN